MFMKEAPESLQFASKQLYREKLKSMSNVGTHFSTRKNLLKKIREKIGIGKNYWLKKVNIDTINWEKVFDRFADHR